jgi:hypothetical protein
MVADFDPSYTRSALAFTVRWVVLVIGVLLVLGSGLFFGASRWLYFGRDPAPADSLGEYRRYAQTLNGLDANGNGNGWGAALETFKIIEAARLDLGVADAAGLRAMLTEVNALGATERALVLMPGLVRAARAGGLDSALDGLCDARVAVAPEPQGGVASWIDPCEVLRAVSCVNRWQWRSASLLKDHGAVLRHALTQLALIRTMTQQPVASCQVEALLSLASDGERLMQAVADGAFDPDELLSLLDELNAIRPLTLSEVLQGERLAAYAATQAVMPAGVRPRQRSRGFNSAALAAHFDRADRFAALPRRERDDPDAWDDLCAADEHSHSDSIMVSLLALDPSTIATGGDLLETHLAGLRGVLAVEAYAQAHGEYPSSLADLVPEFLESEPADPRGPGGIRYALSRDQGEAVGRPYLLYATGLGRIDNGGEGRPGVSLMRIYRSTEGESLDFVFNRLPAPEAEPE